MSTRNDVRADQLVDRADDIRFAGPPGPDPDPDETLAHYILAATREALSNCAVPLNCLAASSSGWPAPGR
jgi:hypothetical protein